MSDKFIVTRTEYLEGMQEQVDNIQNVMDVVNRLKDAHNILSEVVGLLRYVITKYIPQDRLEAATKEYRQQREAMIQAEANAGSKPN